MDFPSTLKLLAKKAGVTLLENAAHESANTKVYEIIESAVLYYEKNLWLPLGAGVLKYLKERGLTEETIRLFHLGLSLNNWDSLYLFLREKGFSDADILKAGVCLKTSQGKLVDRFRNRLMFPLRNQHNQPIAFAGRRLDDVDITEAKYVNSADSPYYHKGEILYNFHLARAERPQFLIVVEGYMDAIMSYQAGVKNVVAVSGTALTLRQAQMLSRAAPKVVLSFDNDEAGEAATIRSLPALLSTDLEINILILDNVKDAGELVAKNPTEWAQAVASSQPYLKVLLEKQAQKFQGDMEAGRKIAQSLVPILASIDDPLKLAQSLKIVALAVGLPVSALEQAVKKGQQIQALGPAEPVAESAADNFILRLQEFLRSLMLYPEGLNQMPADIAEAFFDSPLLTLYNEIKNGYNSYKIAGRNQDWAVYLRKLWQDQEAERAFLFVTLEEEPSFVPAQIFQMALRAVYLPYLKQLEVKLKKQLDETTDQEEINKLIQELAGRQQLYHRSSSQ
ncbi:MAG: hypothetical protein A2117_02750 [Candidatus Wildermuthbacteria bacterium GWA2_46_15]|uniref:Toprim domain-containing protein n=1 Tax=Candidatus Wildermuthbacteria bacterium GWA2_46_15 TaxID=1802443 RepID=A0A1G2QNW1_9BACT|nr:MAG: hypothetical protein A2117_02750 [Candidatus Wildermuthbacteria bacterium GWA2_46_15]